MDGRDGAATLAVDDASGAELTWDERPNLWLPAPLRTALLEAEGGRFSNFVAGLAEVLKAIPSEDHVLANPTCIQPLHTWLQHASKFLRTKTRYDAQDVALLHESVQHVTDITRSHPTIRVGWIELAIKVLKVYRQVLAHARVQLDWTRYWEMLEATVSDVLEFRLDGTARLTPMRSVGEWCLWASHLFEPAAAEAMWSRLKGQLSQPLSPRSLEALTKLLLLFPRRAISMAPELPWQRWVEEAMGIWELVGLNPFWDSGWLEFLYRLAKRDIHGVVHWPGVLQRVCARGLWHFNVPVGTSTSVSMSRIRPAFPLDEVAARVGMKGSPQVSLAQIIIHTLRNEDLRGGGPAGDAAGVRGGGGGGGDGQGVGEMNALQVLRKFALVLEHYFHASNTGPWSEQLAAFLEGLSVDLSRRLALEASMQLPAGVDGSTGRVAAVSLDRSALKPVATELMRMAGPALFHKSGALRAASLETTGTLAYIVPEMVLPMVITRVQEALGATDAVHQLAGAIRALAACVRPMLLVGLPAGPDEADEPAVGEFAAQHRALEVLGQMMPLLIPGLDANDHHKTEQTITFFLALLSNCVAITGRDLPAAPGEAVLEFGVYMEEWVLALLERVFEVIETQAGQRDGEGSEGPSSDGTRIGDCHKFGPLMAELFHKMPSPVLPVACRAVATWSLHVVDREHAVNGFSLLLEAGRAAPEWAERDVYQPLVKLLDDDLAAVEGTANPSRASVARIRARLVLLQALLQASPQTARARLDTSSSLWLRVARVPVPGILDSAIMLLASNIMPLVVPVIVHGDWASPGVPGSVAGAVARWVPEDCSGVPEAPWHQPTAEDGAAAAATLRKWLGWSRETVETMVADGSITDSAHASRQRLYGAQALLEVVTEAYVTVGNPWVTLTGQATGAPAPAGVDPGHEVWSKSIDLVGAETADLAAGEMQLEAVRLSLLIIAKAGVENQMAVRTATEQLELFNGRLLQARTSVHSGGKLSTRSHAYNEPMIADALLGAAPGSLGRGRRQPLWASMRVASLSITRRRSLRASAPAPTAGSPEVKLSVCRPLVRECLGVLMRLTQHRYTKVVMHAVRVLAEYLEMSSEFQVACAPTILSGIVLRPPDGGAAAGSKSAAPDEAGACELPPDYTIPGDLAAAEAQEVRVWGSIVDMVKQLSGPQAASIAQRCNDDNKHVLLGSLTAVAVCGRHVSALLPLRPALCEAIYGSCLVSQAFSLMEVRAHVSRFVTGIAINLLRPPPRKEAASQPAEEPALLRVAAAHITASQDVHWRARVFCHLLLGAYCPLPAHVQLSADVAGLQLRSLLGPEGLQVKDATVSTLLHTLLSVSQPDAAPALQRAVTDTVRDALAAPAAAAALVDTLETLHSLVESRAASMLAASGDHPVQETAALALLRAAAERRRAGSGYLYLCPAPPPQQAQGSGGVPSAGFSWRVAGLLRCLMRMAPGLLGEEVRTRLSAGLSASAEEMAAAPHIDYVTMEVTHAALASGAAFQKLPEAPAESSTPWDAWLAEHVSLCFSAAPINKAPYWAYTLAHALWVVAQRGLAGEAGGDANGGKGVSASDVVRVADFVCSLTEKWTGSSAVDHKHVILIVYCMDMLLQSQTECPSPHVATALERLLARSVAIAELAASHSLQQVRLTSSALLPSVLAVLRAPRALVSPHLTDPATPTSCAANATDLVQRVYDAAHAALLEANLAASDSEPTSRSSSPALPTEANSGGSTRPEAAADGTADAAAGGANGSQAQERWEGAIGTATSLTQSLVSSPLVQPMVMDLMLARGVRWVLAVQALGNPRLQPLTMQARHALVSAKGLLLRPAAVGGLAVQVLEGTRLEAWQSRAAALTLLQCLWFRNVFSFSDAELERLLAACQTTLQDTKLEIRDVAASTVSGLLRILPGERAQAVRAAILSEAARLFPARRKTGAASGASPDSVAQHACVLSLSSLLQSSPYQLHEWMNDVLKALVRAAKYPPPVRTAVGKAIGEFRKTHESSELQPLKERLHPDVWEGILGVGSQSVYFV